MPRKAASGKSATTFGTSKTSFSRSISGRTESPTQNGIIQLTVDRVKAGLTAFAGDIRTNGKDLVKAEERLHGLERLSNSMLDKLASWGAEIDDTPFILRAQDAATTISKAIENGIEGNLVTMADVFDRDYRLIRGSNPEQYDGRFCDFADAHVRPILDRFKLSDARIIGAAITDVNGYLPTHLSERSLPPSADSVWNDAICRNKRIFMDETTRNAVLSERPAMLATYRMEFGDRFVPVKKRVRALVGEWPPLGELRTRLSRRLISRAACPSPSSLRRRPQERSNEAITPRRTASLSSQ